MSEVTSKAARGTLMHLGAQVTLMVSGYAVSVVLARTLGPAEFGAYGVVYSFLVAAELSARLGIPQAAGKLAAETKGPATSIEATGLALSALVYLALFGLMWLAAPALAALFHMENGTELFRIASLDIPFYGLYATLYHILNGRRQFRQETISLTLYGVLKLAGIAGLVAIGPTVEAALVMNVLVSVISLLVAVPMVGAAPFRPSLAATRPVLLLAMPIALMTFGAQLMPTVDLWVLSAFGAHFGEDQPGFYAAAANIARMPNFLANGLASVLLPSIAKALAENDDATALRTLQGAMRFLLIALLPGCVLIAVEAREIMSLLFSAGYAAAGGVLAVLIFAQGMSLTLFVTFCAVLVGAGRQRLAGMLALLVLVPGVALDALLAERFGMHGVAWGSLATTAAAMLLAGGAIQHRLGTLVQPMVLARICLATLLVAAIAWLVPASGWAVLAELVLAALVYVALLPLLGLVRMADLEPFLPTRLRSQAG